MTTKNKFMYIQPKTSMAKEVFDLNFRGLHSCNVVKTKDSQVLLKSIAGEFYFWIDPKKDENWEVIK